MFAYCQECNYDSGDQESLAQLRGKVEKDGGVLDKEKGQVVCSNCGSSNMEID